MSEQRTPDLSVVLTVFGDWDSVRVAMRHLQGQTIADRLEVVLVTPSVDRFELDKSAMSPFVAHQLIEFADFSIPGGPRAAGIRAASAPIVAFTEDHCFPEPAWAETLLHRHQDDWTCVGPVVRSANSDSLTSWADHYTSVFPWIEPASAGPVDSLPWHNSAYKRQVLLDLGTELENLLDPECLLQWELVAQGHRFYLEPLAQVNHVGPSRPWVWLATRFSSGRLYAAARAVHWPMPKRLVYVLGGPLIPALRLWRTVRAIIRSGRAAKLVPRIIPLLIPGLILDGLGQMVGYAFGMGNALRPYFESELIRARYVNDEDQRLLTAA